VPWIIRGPTPKAGYPKQVNNLGDEIRSKRLDLGLQQKEVARRLGVSPETLSNWEKGLTSPQATIYGRLRRVLGL
jgi:transcriptional regulator with XRE-family HTH domain